MRGARREPVKADALTRREGVKGTGRHVVDNERFPSGNTRLYFRLRLFFS